MELDIIVKDMHDVQRRAKEAGTDVHLDLIVGKEKVDHGGAADQCHCSKDEEIVIGEQLSEFEVAHGEAGKDGQEGDTGKDDGQDLSSSSQQRSNQASSRAFHVPERFGP